jgi:tricorn protease-like protein
MNKLFGIFITLVIMSIGISSNALSFNGPVKDKYCIFYGEIETKGCIDLGTRYFIYNISNKKSMEIKNAFNGMPVPTRDLKHFVFFTKKGQNQYLNVLNTDKEKIEKKEKIPILSGELAVSKNMQYMAFCRDEVEGDDKREIYFYNNKSSKLSKITTNDFPDYNPVFSPDGNFILYLSKPNLHSTILK